MSTRTLALATAWLSLAILTGCTQSTREKASGRPAASAPASPTSNSPTASNAEKQGKQPDATKLQITDLVVGTGEVAETGKTVAVHYAGTLTDGTEFDSSRKHGSPFSFPLGAGRVIPGWDEGVKGMKVGGKRKLVIPPDMGYGESGAGEKIPANATLVFEVELLEVK